MATAIREESLEETATGGAEADAAKDPDAADPQMEAALAKVAVSARRRRSPTATGEFKSYMRGSPWTFFGALRLCACS